MDNNNNNNTKAAMPEEQLDNVLNDIDDPSENPSNEPNASNPNADEEKKAEPTSIDEEKKAEPTSTRVSFNLAACCSTSSMLAKLEKGEISLPDNVSSCSINSIIPKKKTVPKTSTNDNLECKSLCDMPLDKKQNRSNLMKTYNSGKSIWECRRTENNQNKINIRNLIANSTPEKPKYPKREELPNLQCNCSQNKICVGKRQVSKKPHCSHKVVSDQIVREYSLYSGCKLPGNDDSNLQVRDTNENSIFIILEMSPEAEDENKKTQPQPTCAKPTEDSGKILNEVLSVAPKPDSTLLTAVGATSTCLLLKHLRKRNNNSKHSKTRQATCQYQNVVDECTREDKSMNSVLNAHIPWGTALSLCSECPLAGETIIRNMIKRRTKQSYNVECKNSRFCLADSNPELKRNFVCSGYKGKH